MREVEIGANTYFQYSPTLSRLAYINALSFIVVTPELHTNQIKFMGFSEPENYFAYKIIRDRLIAFC